MSGRKPTTSKEEQAAIRAALDAALDDIDDDDDDELEEESDEDDEAIDEKQRLDLPLEPTSSDTAADYKPSEGKTTLVESKPGALPVAEGKRVSVTPPPVPTALDEKLAAVAAAAAATEKGGEAMVVPPATVANATSLSAPSQEPTGRVSHPPPRTANGADTASTASPVKKVEGIASDRPFLGPPRPPTATTATPTQQPLTSSDNKRKKKASPHHHHPPTDPDKLFMEMMEDMLLTEQEGVTGPDEMMVRLMQQLQEQLHGLEQEEGDESDDDDDDGSEPPTASDAPPESGPTSGWPSSEVNGGPSTTASGYATPFEYEPPAMEPINMDSSPHPPQSSLPPEPASSHAVEERPSRGPEPNVPPPVTEPAVSSKIAPPEKPPAAGEESKTGISEPRQAVPDPKVSKSSAKAATTTKRKKGSGRPTSQKSVPPSAPTGDNNPHDFDAAISQLLQGMAQQATMMDGGPESETTSADGKGEAELLQMLMKGLNGVSGGANDGGDGGQAGDDDDDFNADAMIDGMMEQLLSKDLMYDPMKQVAARFPKWLEERRNSLSAQELKQRQQQCDCFQKLVHVYETRPDDTAQLMALMQEVQEFGQPPAEIIHDIAPGLELDGNGLPKLNGPLPPFGTGDNNEECRIM